MITLGIFAKPPIPGTVKTRLMADIGAERATAVYRHCLRHALQVAEASELEYQLFLTEATEDPIFGGLGYQLQQGADLGERMQNSLDQMLSEGATAAMIIGTDCLDLSRHHLQQAAAALTTHELVLLPAFDGGYALIGTSQSNPSLFDSVQWSSERVYAQTLTNAEALNYRVCSLETVRDIDTLGDLDDYPELVRLAAER